jgi:hypothetical protein
LPTSCNGSGRLRPCAGCRIPTASRNRFLTRFWRYPTRNGTVFSAGFRT